MVLMVAIVLLSVLMILFAYVLKDKDLCCTNDLCKKFTNICEDSSDILNITSKNGVVLTLENIQENETVDMGTVINGSITGSWFFEGEFPVRILNTEMEILDTLVAKANEDWMTEENVKFELLLDFDIEQEQDIILRFEKVIHLD